MEPLTLTELGRRMSTRWPVLVALAIIGLGCGLAFQLASDPRYRATAVVRVDAAEPALVDMAAEEALASSRLVCTEALDALTGSSAAPAMTIEALEASASARAVPRSRVLEVSFTAASGPAAARGADALAQAYLAVRDVDVSRRARSAGGSASSADILDPARTPDAPVGPGLAVSTVAGLVLGLLAATPIAARPRRRRRRSRSSHRQVSRSRADHAS